MNVGALTEECISSVSFARIALTRSVQANPRLASRRDEDDRLPLHWAVSYNRLPIVSLLMQAKGFDADATVCQPPGTSGVQRRDH